MQKILLTASKCLLEHPIIVQEIMVQSSRNAHLWSSLNRNQVLYNNNNNSSSRLVKLTGISCSKRISQNVANVKKTIEEEIPETSSIPPQQIITPTKTTTKKVPDPLSTSTIEIPSLNNNKKNITTSITNKVHGFNLPISSLLRPSSSSSSSSLSSTAPLSTTIMTTVEEEEELKPLKLLNTVDPTVLSNLYKSNESLNSIYLSLAKSRLTSFVVITAMAGYTLSSATLVSPDLIWVSVGTFLTSASANTINQIIERDYDGLMDRTKNRVLVKKLITPQHAMYFGAVAGLGGMACLYSVNELCAVIGLANLVLYTCAYTPLKRKHIINTWVGSIVGALPPLIGYAGAVNYIDSKALVLSAIMFAWQFPHFNALSWNLRKEYDRAGYKMMCFVNERLCRATTMRYSLLLTAVCAASPIVGAAEWSFAIDSGFINAYLCYLSWKFYKNPDAKTSRSLFRYTLIHLPLLIVFLILSKKNPNNSKEVVIQAHA